MLRCIFEIFSVNLGGGAHAETLHGLREGWTLLRKELVANLNEETERERREAQKQQEILNVVRAEGRRESPEQKEARRQKESLEAARIERERFETNERTRDILDRMEKHNASARYHALTSTRDPFHLFYLGKMLLGISCLLVVSLGLYRLIN